MGQKYGADEKTKRMEYKCIRSFGSPVMTGHLEDPEKELYSGYDLKMNSTQAEKGKPKTSLTFKVRCDPDDKKDKVEWK